MAAIAPVLIQQYMARFFLPQPILQITTANGGTRAPCELHDVLPARACSFAGHSCQNGADAIDAVPLKLARRSGDILDLISLTASKATMTAAP